MPFLGFGNYAKPGPGVKKETEDKSAFIRFFTIYKRRFSKFVQLNLIFMIPVVAAILLMCVLFFLPGVRYSMALNLSGMPLTVKLWEMYVVPMPLILLAPFCAGLMVVSRRLANEEYAFIWSEYWKGVAENWKQFLINGIFAYAVYVLLSFSFIYYSASLTADNFWSYIPYGMVILVAIIFLFSQFYVSTMIVSVNLKITHIYKNALIFALMGLGRNFLLTAILAVIIIGYLNMSGLVLLLGLLLAVILLFSFISYSVSFITYPLIKSYIINPYENKDIVKNNPETQPSTTDFTYAVDELDSEVSKDQYIYVSGKLVKMDSEDEEEQIFKDE